MGLQFGEAPIHRHSKWQYTHIPIQPEITQLHANNSSNLKKKSTAVTENSFLLTAHKIFTTVFYDFSSNMCRKCTEKTIYIIQSYIQTFMPLHIKNTLT
jgi:hypothetical protein